ncbi:MAG: hypothetical protein IPO78_17540 [Saprospiraceae bacterium]|nr:hypothetical protein [Saprospiraceae bacterium]
MRELKSLYVGSGQKIPKEGIKIQLDLTQLWEYTKGEAALKIKEYKDKNGKVHKTIDLVIFPLKEENQNQYRTHSVKIDTWEKPTNEAKEQSDNDMPF